MAFRIRLEKENFKFSCSHFTIFGPKSGESLHGHNYYVSGDFSVDEIDPKLGMAFDFNLLKPILKSLTEKLDERVLIPMRSPYLKISKTDSNGQPGIEVKFDSRTYLFPEADTRLLDVVNITTEQLTQTFANDVKAEIKKNPELKSIRTISIGIQETRGQTVFYDTDL